MAPQAYLRNQISISTNKITRESIKENMKFPTHMMRLPVNPSARQVEAALHNEGVPISCIVKGYLTR